MIGDLQFSQFSDRIPKALLADMKAAVPFYLDLLLPGKEYDALKRELSIDIVYKKQPPKEQSSSGWTMSYDETTFLIELYQNKGECDILQVLAHEMVHVKQYALGELRERVSKGSSSILWKHRRWIPPEGGDEYWDSPWEIEAFGREYGMWKRFVNSQYG